MKKFLLVLFSLLLSIGFSIAQNYNIDAVDGDVITDCTITLYDSGGNGGDYSSDETYSVTVCSGTADAIEITFVDFDTESGWDGINIYDGTGTGGTLLGNFEGATIPGNVTSTSTCITIEFYSDSSLEYGGFQLTTACVAPPVSPCTAVTNLAGCGAANSATVTTTGAAGQWSTSYCGYSTPGSEHIYSFTPTVTASYSIVLSAADGSFLDYGYQANTCASTGWTCIDDLASAGTYGAFNLTAGTTYYFLLDDESTTSTTHTFYISCPPCTPANANVVQNCASDFLSYDLDVEIVSMVDAATVDIIVGGTTEYSNVGVGNYNVAGLVAGTTVEVVDHADPTCIYSITFDMCDADCDSPTAPSDECVDAPLIDLSQPFEGSTDCAYTASVGNPENCGSIENDSFISFIAGDTDVEMDYTVGECEPMSDGIQLSVFSGTCGSLVDLAGSCVNPTGENTTGTWNFTGLTIGETYYIRIDGYAGDLCDYYFEPITGVVITPPNDSCPDATPLNCGDSDIASNILATDNDAPIGCSGGGTPSAGVWYSFIGDGSDFTITTDNAGTNFDTEINVFVGPCTALTCVGGDDDGGTGTTSSYTFTTTNGVEYFVYVDGVGAAVGQFEISLICTAAPPCDADAGVWD